MKFRFNYFQDGQEIVSLISHSLIVYTLNAFNIEPAHVLLRLFSHYTEQNQQDGNRPMFLNVFSRFKNMKLQRPFIADRCAIGSTLSGKCRSRYQSLWSMAK
jgi:hypothetical protein